MTISRLTMMILPLTLAFTSAALAQETGSAATQTTKTATRSAQVTATTTATDGAQAGVSAPQTSEPSEGETSEREEVESSAARQEVRQKFNQLLARHPDDLTRLLALDPSLLTNEPFLAKYPELSQFLIAHPQIRRNPHFYLQDHEFDRNPPRMRSGLEEFAEMLSEMFVALLVTGALVWLIRTIIEQKRWSQLARRQSEVHTKILDRLASSEELLTYIKTPAGTKYLESAPIPLHAASATPRSSIGRVLLSIQIGIIVAAGGFGLILVSRSLSGDARQAFFAMGAVAFCLGGGFIASAAVSLFLSRRLGGTSVETTLADDPGTMR